MLVGLFLSIMCPRFRWLFLIYFVSASGCAAAFESSESSSRLFWTGSFVIQFSRDSSILNLISNNDNKTQQPTLILKTD